MGELGLGDSTLYVQGCTAGKGRVGTETNTWWPKRGELLVGVDRWKTRNNTRYGKSFLTFMRLSLALLTSLKSVRPCSLGNSSLFDR